MNNDHDIVAIGDSVIEPFIRLSLGHTQTDEHGGELCIPFGTKIPYESATLIAGVGNAANAAVSASRIGLKVALVTFLGNDSYGLECINRLQREGVDMCYAVQQDGKNTNYHYVLWYGEERTILIKHEKFDYKLPEIGSPKWLYFSSVAEHTEAFHKEVADYLNSHPDVKLAFQPGTFQMKMGTELLKDIYARTEVFCANKEEYELILNMKGSNVKEMMDKMQTLGPKIVLLSDGPHGAYMKADGKYFSVPLYPDIAPPLERTGAGDAFASTFVSYLAKGLSPEEALLRAPINSMNVNQHVGAQEGLLVGDKIEEYLKNAPSEYKLSEI